MTKQRCCNYCGQPLPDIRLGVKLTPEKARIFDHIQRCGEWGISGPHLAELTRKNLKCVQAHIFQINEYLLETDYHIDHVNGAYLLVQAG